MAIPHARAGEPVSLQPKACSAEAAHTTTLIKTEALEVIRMVLPTGKELARHQVPGEVTLQCLTGRVTLHTGGSDCELAAGMLTFLAGGQEHSLSALQDSLLLVTILLSPKSS